MDTMDDNNEIGIYVDPTNGSNKAPRGSTKEGPSRGTVVGGASGCTVARQKPEFAARNGGKSGELEGTLGYSPSSSSSSFSSSSSSSKASPLSGPSHIFTQHKNTLGHRQKDMQKYL